MIRTLTACRFALLVLFALVAVTCIPAAGLNLTTSLDGMASPASLYLVPTVAFTVGPPEFQFGAEVKLPVGLRGDKYLAAMLLLKFRYADFGVGVSTRLVGTADSSLAYPDAPQSFTCRMGINWPIWTIGPGKLGLNTSVEWLSTEYAPSEYNPPTATSLEEGMLGFFIIPFYAIGWAIGEAIKEGAKLSVGVNYTLDL
jgi:hypothetical protein